MSVLTIARVARDNRVARTVGSRLLRVVLAAAIGVVVARGLRPDGRGQYDVLVTIAATAVSLGNLAIEQAHSALWHRHRAAIPANSLVLGPVIGTVAMAVAGTVVVALGPRVVPVPGYALVAIALAAVPFAMAALYLNNVLVLQARAELMNRAATIGSAVQVGALIALYATGRLTVGRAVAIWTVLMIVPLIPVLAAIRPRPGDRDLRLARRVVWLGLRYHPGCASLFLLYRADVLILNAMAPPAMVGLYTVGVTIAETARIVTDTLSQVSLSAQVGTEPERAVGITVRTTRVSTMLALVAVGGMALAAPWVLPIVYGHAFAAGVPALLALAPGMFALGATRPLGNYLLRLQRPAVSSTISVAAVAGNIALIFLLVPWWGIVGCALASSIGYTGYAAAQVVWFCRSTGTPWRRLLPGRSLRGDLQVLRA